MTKHKITKCKKALSRTAYIYKPDYHIDPITLNVASIIVKKKLFPGLEQFLFFLRDLEN